MLLITIPNRLNRNTIKKNRAVSKSACDSHIPTSAIGGTNETAIDIPGNVFETSFLIHAKVAATPEANATRKYRNAALIVLLNSDEEKKKQREEKN